MRSSREPEKTGLIRPRLRELMLRKFRLRVVEGPDLGVTVISGAEEFSIGSAEGNSLVLSDATVSRHHCQIVAGTRGFLLRDLGSTNGTWVDGMRLEGAFIKQTTSLRVGQSTLAFEALDETVREPLSDADRFDAVLGASTAMRRIFAVLPRVAACDSTVLILGETGTGKGLLAEAIHRQSPRAKGPFVPVDCSSIPLTLVESELLGHERGAFTGAHSLHQGVFETARGGTVFLDEIGELPLEMQPKLLRALEERRIRRVGGTDPIQLDVRIVVATNRDLRHSVNQGEFRSDLFYRLNTVTVTMPPLRARPEDIRLLAERFYAQFSVDEGRKLPPEVLASLEKRDWPGNVRELRSWVERAVVVGPEETSLLEAVRPEVASVAPSPAGPESAELLRSLSFRAAKELVTSRWERAYLAELLQRTGGNVSRAAREARMDRNHLRELLRRHHIAAMEDG